MQKESENPNLKKKIFISNKIKKIKNWTSAEDELLLKIAKQFSYKNWKGISSHLPGRTAIQCSARYKRINPEILKGSWTVEEDQALMHLLSKFGKNWGLISKYMHKRSGKQIRDRFLNALDSNIVKEKFSPEEDQLIMKLYESYGTCWTKIAKYVPGRTGDMIKNRFYASLRKKIHEEDYRASLLKKRETKKMEHLQRYQGTNRKDSWGNSKNIRRLVLMRKKTKRSDLKEKSSQSQELMSLENENKLIEKNEEYDSDTMKILPLKSIPIKESPKKTVQTFSSFQTSHTVFDLHSELSKLCTTSNINNTMITRNNNNRSNLVNNIDLLEGNYNSILTSQQLCSLIKALTENQEKSDGESRHFLEIQLVLLKQLHFITKTRLETVRSDSTNSK